MERARRISIVALGINLVVILLGALVRATGSGAGCGRSWPTCNGTLVPELQGATAIEFTHRASSGIALIAVAVMFWAVYRATERGHPARTGAVVSGISIVIEALIGAVIVLAEWVANDASVARAVSVPIHLVSTFVLLGGLVLTVFWLSGGRRVRLADHGSLSRGWGLLAIGMLAIGATGGVTALADTVFPKESFDVAGLFATDATEHFLTRLRAVHPVVATLIGALAARWAYRNVWQRSGAAGKAARIVVALVAIEFALGIANVFLLTPVWLSLTHLAVADGLWMAWVWLGAEMFQEPGAG
ncbi:MAG: heme A synthase [Acidobacteria bacterium]|nr:heme A synthase [Acidobacteriota bacterium]